MLILSWQQARLRAIDETAAWSIKRLELGASECNLVWWRWCWLRMMPLISRPRDGGSPASPAGTEGTHRRLPVQQPPPPRAVQVTALGQPKLLERVSNSLIAVQHLFRRFDHDLNGVVTRDEFEMVRLTLSPRRAGAAPPLVSAHGQGSRLRCTLVCHLRLERGQKGSCSPSSYVTDR